MPGAAVRAAHGVGCSWEGVQTLLWVSDKGVLATEVVQPVTQRFAFQVVLPQSSGCLFLPGPPEWFSFLSLGHSGPPVSVCRRVCKGKGQLSRPRSTPGGGRPLPSTPASRPEGRAGAVWWLRCPSGSGCRSPRCRGAAGGGLLEGRVGGWTGREDGRAG